MTRIILLVMILLSIANVSLTAQTDKQTILNKIEERDSILGQLNKKELPDSLKKQVADFRLLTEILENENGQYRLENEQYRLENLNLQKELRKYLLLTSSDTLIFHQDFKSINEIPVCLQERVKIVNAIVDLQEKISTTENTAYELELSLGKTTVSYAAIGERIENEVDKIGDLIRSIKTMDLSTLSEEQKVFFQELIKRYNHNFIKKYFE